MVVCLAASAAKVLIGRGFKVTQQRGVMLESDIAEVITATVHPSSILRAPDTDSRRLAMNQFIKDLKCIAGHLPRVCSKRCQKPLVCETPYSLQFSAKRFRMCETLEKEAPDRLSGISRWI
jgi:hypothetical protein